MTNNSAKVSVIDLPAMKVAGLGADFISALVPGTNAFEVLPALWGRVSEIVASLNAGEGAASVSKKWMVGALGEPDVPAYAEAGEEVEGLLNYFAGIRVDGLSTGEVQAFIDAGLQLRDYEAGRFASCEHVGPLDGLGATTAWFYQNYLPSEGLPERYGHHFEIYDERFDLSSPDSVVMICAPIK